MNNPAVFPTELGPIVPDSFAPGDENQPSTMRYQCDFDSHEQVVERAQALAATIRGIASVEWDPKKKGVLLVTFSATIKYEANARRIGDELIMQLRRWINTGDSRSAEERAREIGANLAIHSTTQF